mgnify:CR=1 FL=1
MVNLFFKSRLFERLTEIFLPTISWLTITLPLWLSPFHPAVVGYFIIAFNVYFFYKSIKTIYHAVISYQKIELTKNINFAKKIEKLIKKQKIYHFVIIPNYKEPVNKLKQTIKAIIENDYPQKIYLVLAFEKREKEAIKKAKILIDEFKNYFQKIFTTFHPLLKKEVEGKASNQTYAAKFIENFLKQKNIDYKKVLITICDADSILPKNYFSYLTYQYLKDKDRLFHFYWAPVLLYNNFWQLPIFVRIQATLSSILRLAFLAQKENLIQISTYSTSFWLLKQVNFWDTNIIPEDWHIYLQAFFKFGQKVKTLPLYTIVNGDAVYSGGLLKTLINRYQQEKRWAWGASDISYTLKNFFTTPHVPFFLKLSKLIFIFETHFLWSTSFFILTLSSSIPPLINPIFKKTVMGFLLPKISAFILTLSSSMIVFYIILDIIIRKKIKQKTKITSLPILIIQWYLLPVVSFLFSSLPALEAQTRLLLKKPIKYKVTEKV